MKKSCKNINITNPDTIRPYVEECLSRHKKKRKFWKLIQFWGPEFQTAVNRIAGYAAQTIADRVVPAFAPKSAVRMDSSSGKERLIGCETAMQQVFDYIAVRSCTEIWKRRCVPQQCSSIKGRGQIYGVNLIKSYIKQDNRAARYARKYRLRYTPKCKYFVKLDVRHCYQSISRALLIRLMEHDCKNQDILYLWKTLTNSYTRAAGCTGLLIGALPSQWAAQLVLSYLYRFTMAQDGPKHMLMFMDDMLIMGGNRRKLKKTVEKLIEYAKEKLGLTIKPHWHIKRLDHQPIDMMGFVVHGNGKVTIRAKNFVHARRMLLRQQRKPLVYSQAKRLVSYKGYFKYSDCWKLRKEMNLKSAFEQAQQTISNYERSKRNESILRHGTGENLVSAFAGRNSQRVPQKEYHAGGTVYI